MFSYGQFKLSTCWVSMYGIVCSSCQDYTDWICFQNAKNWKITYQLFKFLCLLKFWIIIENNLPLSRVVPIPKLFRLYLTCLVTFLSIMNCINVNIYTYSNFVLSKMIFHMNHICSLFVFYELSLRKLTVAFWK